VALLTKFVAMIVGKEQSMSTSTHLKISKLTPGYWRATLSNPPAHILTDSNDLSAALRCLFLLITSRMNATRRAATLCWWLSVASLLVALTCGSKTALAVFAEPEVFASEHSVLDIIMIAKPKPIPSISFTPPDGGGAVNPVGWVYEVCRRPASGDYCPPGAGTVADYGGVRLALQQGDALKIRLINQLPKIDPAKLTYLTDPGGANLYLNPTNLHTHGFLVPARGPTPTDPSLGDYIFVSVFNSANGIPAPQTHEHGSIVMDAVDYRIEIPKNHPSGLYWFHPHVHGLTLNHVSSGLAGIITIGSVGHYARGDAVRAPIPEAQVRHLILKDMQVLAAGTIQFHGGPTPVANGEVLNQQDSDFCAQFPADASEVRQGSCPGGNKTASGGNDYTGGRWYFTVNGEPYPTIRMTDPDGEVWRLTNASGNVSYNLQLVNDADGTPMITQLLAVDGVSVHLPQDTTRGTMVELTRARFKVVDCPAAPSGDLRSLPVCVSELVMMPSARAELWVTYRTPEGRVAPPPTGATATFKMVGLTTGTTGNKWPAVDLAKVGLGQAGSQNLVSSALDVQGHALAVMQPAGIFRAPVPGASPAPLSGGCNALASGHRRRIFFGFENVAVDGTHALGYEEVNEHGAVVPGTQRPLTRFDPSQTVICLPLGPGQTPVHETWELVQLSTENHNFHIHQTRFQIVGPSGRPPAGGIFQDNVPMGVAVPNIPEVMEKQNGVCTVDQWRNSQCSSTPIVIDIPFSQLGEFVYHCHILKHEDAGMMAKIRVVPSPN
jgi:L-ascorbate oxidase